MDKIKTWQQGYFVDQPKYRSWSDEDKILANRNESLNVRPSPTGNAICRCSKPSDAVWIAQRLNLASKFEDKIWRIGVYCYGVRHSIVVNKRNKFMLIEPIYNNDGITEVVFLNKEDTRKAILYLKENDDLYHNDLEFKIEEMIVK